MYKILKRAMKAILIYFSIDLLLDGSPLNGLFCCIRPQPKELLEAIVCQHLSNQPSIVLNNCYNYHQIIFCHKFGCGMIAYLTNGNFQNLHWICVNFFKPGYNKLAMFAYRQWWILFMNIKRNFWSIHSQLSIFRSGPQIMKISVPWRYIVLVIEGKCTALLS